MQFLSKLHGLVESIHCIKQLLMRYPSVPNIQGEEVFGILPERLQKNLATSGKQSIKPVILAIGNTISFKTTWSLFLARVGVEQNGKFNPQRPRFHIKDVSIRIVKIPANGISPEKLLKERFNWLSMPIFSKDLGGITPDQLLEVRSAFSRLFNWETEFGIGPSSAFQKRFKY
eukprot:Gb_40062 [translate_table: standard]